MKDELLFSPMLLRSLRDHLALLARVILLKRGITRKLQFKKLHVAYWIKEQQDRRPGEVIDPNANKRDKDLMDGDLSNKIKQLKKPRFMWNELKVDLAIQKLTIKDLAIKVRHKKDEITYTATSPVIQGAITHPEQYTPLDGPKDELLFTSEDLTTIEDPLARLLRVVMIASGNGTKNKFQATHRAYWLNEGGADNDGRNVHFNNTKRAIRRPTVMWNQFLSVVENILQLEIHELLLTATDENGIDAVYSSNDPIIRETIVSEEQNYNQDDYGDDDDD